MGMVPEGSHERKPGDDFQARQVPSLPELPADLPRDTTAIGEGKEQDAETVF